MIESAYSSEVSLVNFDRSFVWMGNISSGNCRPGRTRLILSGFDTRHMAFAGEAKRAKYASSRYGSTERSRIV